MVTQYENPAKSLNYFVGKVANVAIQIQNTTQVIPTCTTCIFNVQYPYKIQSALISTFFLFKQNNLKLFVRFYD